MTEERWKEVEYHMGRIRQIGNPDGFDALFLEVAEELSSRRYRDRWIPAEERLPPEGMPVLTFQGGVRSEILIAHVTHSPAYGQWAIHPTWRTEYMERLPTHWRPLPDPPEKAKGGKEG